MWQESVKTKLGLSASAGGVSLGITRVMGTNRSIEYFGVTSDLVVYDYDNTGRVYHTTAKNK